MDVAELLFVAGIEWVLRHSGSVIMSAVYSYGAARRDDRMIEIVKMSSDVLKDMNPLLFAIFIAFPSRGPHHLSDTAVSYRLMCSFPPPVMATWHEPQENFRFVEEISKRPSGYNIYLHGAWFRKCNMM